MLTELTTLSCRPLEPFAMVFFVNTEIVRFAGHLINRHWRPTRFHNDDITLLEFRHAAFPFDGYDTEMGIGCAVVKALESAGLTDPCGSTSSGNLQNIREQLQIFDEIKEARHQLNVS